MSASEDDWRHLAACRGADPALWHPTQGDQAVDAKRVCHQCPVEAQCLDANIWEAQCLDANIWEAQGIFGGLNAKERRAERQRRGLTQPPPEIAHGEARGYVQHKRQGIPACAACRLAHAIARAEIRERGGKVA